MSVPEALRLSEWQYHMFSKWYNKYRSRAFFICGIVRLRRLNRSNAREGDAGRTPLHENPRLWKMPTHIVPGKTA